MSAAKPLNPNGAAVRNARKWLAALKTEARARADYEAEPEPRARERARKRWLAAMNSWAVLPRPSDEALCLARK